MRGLYSEGIYGKPIMRQAGAGGRGESVSCSGG